MNNELLHEDGNIERRIKEIHEELQELALKQSQLLTELKYLQDNQLIIQTPQLTMLGTAASEKVPVLPEEKIKFFLKLFRCRDDIYPRFWENKKKGIKGYSPVCQNEWVKGICKKPKIKCLRCEHQKFLPLDEEAVRKHLSGEENIGTYAIRKDDACTFLCADFDGDSWQDDVLVYKSAARDFGIDIAVERSKSGKGAHAWIFFSEPVQASAARQMGATILTRVFSLRHSLSLKSYDRFFPNQDTLPKGGFGNLIALPLQKISRKDGNSVFVDNEFKPFLDQWDYLSKRKRISANEIREVLSRSMPKEEYQHILYENEDIAMAERTIDLGEKDLPVGIVVKTIGLKLKSQLEIPISHLPSQLIWILKRTATFANPKYFELQRLRFSTWKIPKYIFCGEYANGILTLPRGSLDKCLELFKKAGTSVEIADERNKQRKIKVSFKAKLEILQKKALTELSKYETGVLVAPSGAGKTVIACALIAKRKVPTLILVHRKHLLEQWKERLSSFLGFNVKEIGVLEKNQEKVKGKIDIAMMQTLSKHCLNEDALSRYEQVIVDECHHIPAYTFESVLKQMPARFVVGLTATPYRRDGHQPIIYMQCGPIRYEMHENTNTITFQKKVIFRETTFNLPLDSSSNMPIQEVWDYLSKDKDRINMVAKDVKDALEQGKFPLILSERKEHLALVSKAIKELTSDLPVREFVFVGDIGKSARKRALEEIKLAHGANLKPYILATGSLIGEGFDLPELDTLVLAFPISFKGKLIQYAGRLFRKSPGKSGVEIYDYVDTSSGLAISMFRKRLISYKRMGFKIEVEEGSKLNRWVSSRSWFGK